MKYIKADYLGEGNVMAEEEKKKEETAEEKKKRLALEKIKKLD